MLILESELRDAAAATAIDPAWVNKVVAVERRELVPLLPELRLTAYAGVLLILSAVGRFMAQHLDDIGPVAISVVLGAAALAVYFFVFRKRASQPEAEPLAGLYDYVALLAALLLSADVGYIETHFHPLGAQWSLQLLLLAIVHAAVAYRLGSRLVFMLGVTSFLSWLGAEPHLGRLFDSSLVFASRAFLAAGCLGLWRVAHARLSRWTQFTPPLDHLIANLSFWGALALIANEDSEWLGQLLLLLLSGTVLWLARKTRRESFAFYATLYELIGVSASVVRHLHNDSLSFLYLMFAFGFAIVALFVIHAKWKLEEA